MSKNMASLQTPSSDVNLNIPQNTGARDIVVEYSAIIDGVERNGVVYHNGACFFKGLQTPVEMTMTEAEKRNLLISRDQKISDAHEGTLIRVFHIDGEWYVSTNRKLDASNSKWASKWQTFGQSFTQAIKEFVDEKYEPPAEAKAEAKAEAEAKAVPINLSEKIKRINEENREFLSSVFDRNFSKNYKYLFILKPTVEERIVCQAEPRPTIYHVGTFDENDEEHFSDLMIDGNIVERPQTHEFSSLQELKAAMDSMNIYHHQGFFVVDEKARTAFKIIHDRYKTLFEVRGNVASLRFRYLQLRRFGCNEAVSRETFEMFLELYNFHKEADAIEQEIYDLCQELHQKYVRVFIEKSDVPLSKTEDNVLKKIIHRKYMETFLPTTHSRVINMITCADPPILNKLLIEKKRKQQQQQQQQAP